MAEEDNSAKNKKNEIENIILCEITRFQNKYKKKKIEIIQDIKDLLEFIYLGVRLIYLINFFLKLKQIYFPIY